VLSVVFDRVGQSIESAQADVYRGRRGSRVITGDSVSRQQPLDRRQRLRSGIHHIKPSAAVNMQINQSRRDHPVPEIDKRYTGWSVHGEDYIEPHVVGEDGYAYLRLYEMTGNTKYLRAAIRCADALLKNYKTGDEKNSPWPVRCYARDGKADGGPMGPYSANVIEPIMLFDELIRLRQGDVDSYQRVRDGAWTWLMKYPMQNNVWVGYFEDVKASFGNMNQVIPLEFDGVPAGNQSRGSPATRQRAGSNSPRGDRLHRSLAGCESS